MIKLFEVGGCVRDEILGIHTKDIDFTVVIDKPGEDLSVDEGWFLMKHFLLTEGFKIFLETKDCFTIRAMFPKEHKHEGLIADFVMARKEVGVVPGTRKPVLELGTLEDDLTRRDFTVNALCKKDDGSLILNIIYESDKNKVITKIGNVLKSNVKINNKIFDIWDNKSAIKLFNPCKIKGAIIEFVFHAR